MAESYSYRVRDRQGALITGEMAADNRDLVLSKLRELGYIPLDVTAKNAGLKREIRLMPAKIKLKDLAVFSRQFATMVNSGLPLIRALSILQDQTESKELASVIVDVRQQVERGSSLSAAMARHPKAFSKLYVSMCRAGETGGVLDSVLLRLAENVEKEVALRQKIKSAMTYPVMVFGLVVVIFTAMLIFVVPTFEGLYSNLGGTLPLPTRILLGLSSIFKKFFPIVLLMTGFGVFMFKRWKKTEKGRFTVDRMKLKAPIFGPLFHKTAMSRFSRTLGVLNRSGVPILQSLEIVGDTVGNAEVGRAVGDVASSVREGESISKPLERHKVFPPMVVQMMSVGEETGALDTMLEKIADFYDDEVTAAVDSLTSLIEPALIAVVGGAVGAMVVALYMPMFNILNLIQ